MYTSHRKGGKLVKASGGYDIQGRTYTFTITSLSFIIIGLRMRSAFIGRAGRQPISSFITCINNTCIRRSIICGAEAPVRIWFCRILGIVRLCANCRPKNSLRKTMSESLEFYRKSEISVASESVHKYTVFL